MSNYQVEQWRRINKRDGVTGESIPGPWHAMLWADTSQPQAWCGSKVKAFNYEIMPPGEQPPGKICAACTSAVIKDQPQSYRRS